MENRLSIALRAARRRPEFINLINTSFHECGLYPDGAPLGAAYERYLSNGDLRPYRPDPAGLPALRTAVSTFYAEAGLRVAPEQVIVTASASESYLHLFTAIVANGGRGGAPRGVDTTPSGAGVDTTPSGAGVVLLPRPGYPLFEDVAVRAGLEPRFYDLRRDRGWAPDLDQIEAMLTQAAMGEGRPAAVVLISPNNPTGHIASETEITALCELCARARAPLIVDEVFSEYRFAAADRALPRPAGACPDARVFTINGASKLLASPDLKVSWIVATGPGRQRAVEALEVEADVYLNASPLNQYAAAALLGEHRPAAVVAEVARRREVLLAALRAANETAGGAISWTDPAGGIHLPVMIDPALATDDEAVALDLLERYDLAVHPGYLYGVETPAILVLSYLAPPEVLEQGARRLGEYLASRRGG